MFFSLVQTLVCVLLINGSLYALHLTGSGSSNIGGGLSSSQSSQSASAGAPSQSDSLLNAFAASQQQLQQHQQHQQHQQQQHGEYAPHSAGMLLRKPGSSLDSSARLNEELADMAQLERERLMLLGLAKQTAASTGHHGRPIITGRIQMTPAEEAESEYAPLLLQQQPVKNFMFGSVVQHPAPADDYDSDEDFDGGGRRPIKYEYGREVQPAEQQYEPQNLDLDAFMELEAEADTVDDIIPDLDGYQYLDELLAEQQKGWQEQQAAGYGGYHAAHAGRQFQHPYQTLEQLEAHPPLALQQLFEQEQRDEAAAKQHAHSAAAGAKQRSGYNMRLQQKWQRKRAQLQQQQQKQQQFQRNIFGHQRQQHHFNAPHTKLSIAHSEATATKHIDKPPASAAAAVAAAASAAMQSSSAANSAATNTQNAPNSQQSHQAAHAPATSSAAAAESDASSGAVAASTAAGSSTVDNIKEQLLHSSSHKRSGGLASAIGGYGGIQPPITHSMASQLMLRTARGQRQYDVPQIECPTAMDGMERFACPTPDLQGRYRCIDDHVLCDGFIDCPEGEDEDRRSCMFYKTTKAHLDVLADALLRWARGR